MSEGAMLVIERESIRLSDVDIYHEVNHQQSSQLTNDDVS
jgi:hypothetical protein